MSDSALPYQDIPTDDIAYYYGPASPLKRAAVSHILSKATEYLVVADNIEVEVPGSGMSHYGLVGEVPPQHSINIINMLVGKHVSLYGLAWLVTLMRGMLVELDKQTALDMVKALVEELERG